MVRNGQTRLQRDPPLDKKGLRRCDGLPTGKFNTALLLGTVLKRPIQTTKTAIRTVTSPRVGRRSDCACRVFRRQGKAVWPILQKTSPNFFPVWPQRNGRHKSFFMTRSLLGSLDPHRGREDREQSKNQNGRIILDAE